MILLTVINIGEWTKVQLDNFAMIIIWFDTDVSENLSRKNENLSILNTDISSILRGRISLTNGLQIILEVATCFSFKYK